LPLLSYAANRWTHFPARVYFGALSVGILIPGLLIAGWLAISSARSERVQLEKSAAQKAGEIAAAIDHEIINAKSMLTALASSHFLQTENFEAFYQQTKAVARQLEIQVVLRDSVHREQIFTTAAPWGAPRLQGNVPEIRLADQQALHTGELAVSNVFFGRLTKTMIVAVVIPVNRNDNPPLFLDVAIPTRKLSNILQRSLVEKEWIASVVDSARMIVARSSQHDRFVGKLIPPGSVLPQDSQGVIRLVTLDGVDTFLFYVRSAVTGWIISVGVPSSALEAPATHAFTSFAIAGSLLLILAIGASHHLGGRLSRAMGALGIDRQPTHGEFRALFESAPNGVMAVNSNGLIALVNAQMETMFAYPREELVGRPVEMLIPEQFRKGHAELRNTYMLASEARPMGAGRELFGQRKDSSTFPIEIGLNPINTGSEALVIATVVDITERKQADERLFVASAKLRSSEEQRDFTVEAAAFGAWSLNLVTDETWWSDRYRKMLGVQDTTVATRAAFLDIVHPSDRPIVIESKRRCVAGHRQYEVEFRIVRPNDQTIRCLNSKGSVDVDETGKPSRIHGVVQDITERIAAEHEREELRRRLMQAHEDERLRLAHELHDQTGQSLAAAMMELKGIELVVDEGGLDRVRRLRKQLDQMGKSLHHIAWELRPASINDLGLASALANHMLEWGEQFGIETDFHCRDTKLDELPEEVRTTIYRAVQEGLTNIAKHALGTTSISVVIDRADAILQVTIEDNGSGFDVAMQTGLAGIRWRGGLGLAGMRERLSLIGGHLEIDSSIGSGTTIFVRIPLEQERITA
jgi:PAS domain S-box-containing protein